MSIPVPNGSKPLSGEDLALLATSPTWAQSPSGWFDRSGNDEDSQVSHPEFGSPVERQMENQLMVDDLDDGLPLSMELRGSDYENTETIHPHYWDQVFTADERLRKMAMARISRGLRNSLHSGFYVLEQSIPRLARLLSECPYQDVHDAIKEMLESISKEMKEGGVNGPVVPRVSRMFRESVLGITTALEPQATLFKASFLNTGRVTHLYRIMAWHPSYLEKHTESYDFLLRAEGPLPFSWRHFLAILSASRFKCEYIVRQQEQEFLLAGGEEAWLENPKLCPPKLLALLEVNALLAHQPWRLLPSHIDRLTKSNDPSSRWTTNEIVHAFLILATFRALSGLAIGMGINHEIDLSMEQYHSSSHKSSSNNSAHISHLSPSNHTSQFDSIDEISSEHNLDLDSDTHSHDIDADADSSETTHSASSSSPSSSSRHQRNEQLSSRLANRAARSSEEEDQPRDAEQRKQLFELAGDNLISGPYYPSSSPKGSSGSLGLNAAGASSSSKSVQQEKSSSSGLDSVMIGGHQESQSKVDRFWKYNEPYEVSHTDFDVRSKEYSVFHIQDWSWEEHAYELIERAYHKEFAQLLDTEFTTIFELTYHNVNGQTGVDTAPFRRSVWYYVHRIHGILHDDYNYATVNELLLRNLKKFTKDLSCTPFAVTPQDLLNLGYSLSPEEKCHIALLATEARKQAELMYALHALSIHLSS